MIILDVKKALWLIVGLASQFYKLVGIHTKAELSQMIEICGHCAVTIQFMRQVYVLI